MTVNTPSRTATVEELRHTINRLQVRANVTRNHPPRTFHAFLHARHQGDAHITFARIAVRRIPRQKTSRQHLYRRLAP